MWENSPWCLKHFWECDLDLSTSVWLVLWSSVAHQYMALMTGDVLTFTPMTNGCASSAFSMFNFFLPLQKNEKFMFCYAIAFRQFKLFFFFKYPVWSECTNQTTWDMMQAPGSKANEIAHCVCVCVCDNGSWCGCCWYNLCSCLGQPPKDKKFRDAFVYFSLYLSGTDSEQPN